MSTQRWILATLAHVLAWLMIFTNYSSAASAQTPSCVDGVWHGRADNLGTAMVLELRCDGNVVSGTVTRSRGPRGGAPAQAVGRWDAPRLVLTLHLDASTAPVLDLRLANPATLTGTLTWSGPSVQPMTFVRP